VCEWVSAAHTHTRLSISSQPSMSTSTTCKRSNAAIYIYPAGKNQFGGFQHARQK